MTRDWTVKNFPILKSLLFCVLSVATFGASFALFAETISSQASVKFDHLIYDFGAVTRGQILQHKFPFLSTGPDALVIQGVHAVCGCTAAKAEKQDGYLTNESGFIEVTLDTTSFDGPLDKTVSVMTNSKTDPEHSLHIKANIRSEFMANPPIVDFGDVFSKTGANKKVTITSRDGFKFVAKELKYNPKVLSVKSLPDGNDWVLDVQLKSGLPAKFLKETIYVKNNSEFLSELPILVRANVKKNVDVQPKYIEFGTIEKNSHLSRVITFSGPEKFNLSNYRAEININGSAIKNISPYVKLNNPEENDNSKTITVELSNSTDLSGSVHGKIYFKPSEPQANEFAVDFYAFFL